MRAQDFRAVISELSSILVPKQDIMNYPEFRSRAGGYDER
jgi:hypothetical protein